MQEAVAVSVEGEGALTALRRIPGPPGLRATTGTAELQEAGVAGPAGATAGATNRGDERRCYDKERQEGQ